jgi:hypothetical protein
MLLLCAIQGSIFGMYRSRAAQALIPSAAATGVRSMTTTKPLRASANSSEWTRQNLDVSDEQVKQQWEKISGGKKFGAAAAIGAAGVGGYLYNRNSDEDHPQDINDLLSSKESKVNLQPTFSEFFAMVKSLPKNREEFNASGNGPNPNVDSVFAKAHPEEGKQRQEKSNPDDWLTSNEGEKQSKAVTSPNADRTFEPYAEKIVAKPGEEYILHGDLHGDIISLVTQLDDLYKAGKMDNNFKLKPGVKLMFLGDYVDRGSYGSEVWYTLMRLANANPKQVTLIRGNHEDAGVADRYGFTNELYSKFGRDSKTKDLYDQINKTHELMPVVAYLGNEQGKFLQLCHGGIESGYNPGPLLDSKNDHAYQQLGVLNRHTCCDAIVKDPATSRSLRKSLQSQAKHMHDNVKLDNPSGNGIEPSLGFMWNDFATNEGGGEPVVYKESRGGFEYGKDGTAATLRQQGTQRSEIVRVIRAHQHAGNAKDPMMKKIVAGKGVAHFWGGSKDGFDGVMTMNVAPDSVYGHGVGFDYDTSMGVSTDKQGNWSNLIYNHQPLVKNQDTKNPYAEKEIIPKQEDSVMPMVNNNKEALFNSQNTVRLRDLNQRGMTRVPSIDDLSVSHTVRRPSELGK